MKLVAPRENKEIEMEIQRHRQKTWKTQEMQTWITKQ